MAEVTSLGIGTYGNMSSAGEMINKANSAANLAYGRKNNAKIAKFYENVYTLVQSMATDDKLNLLGEYGDTGKLNRSHSNLNDVLTETIIINLPAAELEMLVRDVKVREQELKKDLKNINNRANAGLKKARTSFNSNSFEEIYEKVKNSRNTYAYNRHARKHMKDFKVPRKMKTVYTNLRKEVLDLLKNFYDKIDVASIAAEMGIDIDGMTDKEVHNAIINKTLLYVDLIVGKSKKNVNYGGAIIDRKVYDEKILQYTSYAWITGKPGMSIKEILAKREEAKAAKRQMEMRIRITGSPKRFNKRFSLFNIVRTTRLKASLQKGGKGGLKNPDLVLDFDAASNRYEIKNITELYKLCAEYGISYGKNESPESLAVRIDREYTKRKKKFQALYRSRTSGISDGLRKKFSLFRRIDNARDVGKGKGKGLTNSDIEVMPNGWKKEIQRLIDSNAIYLDKPKKEGEEGEYRFTISNDVVPKIGRKTNLFHRIITYAKYGRRNSGRRLEMLDDLDAVRDSLFKDYNKDHSKDHDKYVEDKKAEESAKKEKDDYKKLIGGTFGSLFSEVPTVLTASRSDIKTINTDITHAVPVLVVNDILTTKSHESKFSLDSTDHLGNDITDATRLVDFYNIQFKQTELLQKYKENNLISSLYKNVPVLTSDYIKNAFQPDVLKNIPFAVPSVTTNIPTLRNSSLVSSSYTPIDTFIPVLVINDKLKIDGTSSEDVTKLSKDSARISREAQHVMSADIVTSRRYRDKLLSDELDFAKNRKNREDEINKGQVPLSFVNIGATEMKFTKFDTANRTITPVYVINKEPEDKTYEWLESEFPKYMLGFASDIVTAPMGVGAITRPTLITQAALSMGTSAAVDALKLVDTKLGNLFALSTGGVGKATAPTSAFISGDNAKGLNVPGSNPELVNIDWTKKSYSVQPLPMFAKGGGESASGKVTRMTSKERTAPLSVGFSSHIVRFNRSLDNIIGETNPGEAIKVYTVNPGITDVVDVGGTKTNLIDMVAIMSQQLNGIIQAIGAIPSNSGGDAMIINNPQQKQEKQNPYLTDFPNNLDSILKGV